jgi:ABC-type uncharacterized transport system involved in gliding motility auxiliary subunit
MAFKSSKARWRFNHWVSLLLVFVIFLLVQAVNFKYFQRVNISPIDYLKLSEMSRNIIRNLPGPVTMTAFIAPQGDPLAQVMQGDVMELLDQYRFNSNGKISVRRVDPNIDFDAAKNLVDEFKLLTNENVVVIQYEDRSRVLRLADLGDVDLSGAMYQAPPRLIAFKGEQEITSAIQGLVAGERARVYFTTGHGEFNPLAPEMEKMSYSLIGSFVERQNAEIRQINLAQSGEVPMDADLVVVAGPRSRFSAGELEILRAYAEREGEKPGRLMILLDPETETGLEDFLKPYGVIFENNLAVVRITIMGQGRVLADAIGVTFADHPAILWARNLGANLVMGACRSLTISAAPESGALVTDLVQTPDAYWGETDFTAKEMVFNAEKDQAGPLSLAVAIDLGGVQDGQVDLSSPKMIAVGGAAFLMNENLGSMQVDFFVNAVNWLLGKDESLGISPKEPREFKVSLEPGQQQWITVVVLLIIPGVLAVAGLIVWWRRRA